MGISGKKILIFLPCVPYPLRNNGTSVRYLPIIEYLSRSNIIDLVIFRPDPGKEENREELQRYCRNISYVHDPQDIFHSVGAKLVTYGGALLPCSPPFSLVRHGARETEQVIVKTAQKDEYDVLLWVGAMLLPHLMSVMPLKSVKRHILDLIDSPSLIKERQLFGVVGNRVFEKYDLWKTRRCESEAVRRMDETIYISDVDMRAIPESPAVTKRKHTIPNGVEFESYTSKRAGGIAPPSIGFLGNMAYEPNVEAVHWLFENVFLPVRREMSGLSLVIIGKDPAHSVMKLRSEPGVVVTGTVDDIWPYINAVDLFVLPLQRGAGLKNKIIECMMAGRPVITTPIGNEGIDAVSGKEIVISNSPEEFRMEILRLLYSVRDRKVMGDAACCFVKERFSWDNILPRYENIIFGKT